MTSREALNIIKEAGTPLAVIAKNIGKDPSTINKWAKGQSEYLSEKTEQELIEEIRRLKALWESINI